MEEPPEKKLRVDRLFEGFRAANESKKYPGKSSSVTAFGESESPLDKSLALRESVRRQHPQYADRPVVQELLSLVYYFVDEAHISGGHLTATQYLRVFLAKFPHDFRAHGGTLFRYQTGCWGRVESPTVESCPLESFLTAAEGLFLYVATNRPNWAVGHVLQTAQPLFDGVPDDDVLVEKLCQLAREHWDLSRTSTKGRQYNAHWAARLADVCLKAKVWFGRDLERGTESSLWRTFVRRCETPAPKNNGICFSDVYLDAAFNERPRNRANNCYVSISHKYDISEDDCSNGATIADYQKKLRTFVESFYYGNAALFAVQLANLLLALSGIPTHKILFEVGPGGDGKGMEATLHRNVLGSKNCATLEPAVFTEAKEFRKSGHFAWGKTMVRLQEMRRGEKKFAADIWKRWVVGEEIDVRSNYAQTTKLSFGGSMKIQDCNIESIPVIECKDDKENLSRNADYCEQLHRRVICAIVGKATLTRNTHEVDEANGVYLRLPPSNLTSFLEDTVTASLFLREYCIEFWRQFTIEECAQMVESPGEDLMATTNWLAKKLSGCTAEGQPGGPQPPGGGADLETLVSLHAELQTPPGNSRISGWRVRAATSLPGRKEGRPQALSRLLERTACFSKFFFRECRGPNREGNEETFWIRRPIDMKKYLRAFGDEGVFGSWEDLKYDWAPEEPPKEWVDAEEGGSRARASREVTAIVCEIVCLGALKRHHASGLDRREGQLAAYIRKVEAEGERLRGGFFAVRQEYCRLVGFGKAYGGFLSLQNLTREARGAALEGVDAVEWDMQNAQPSLLFRVMVTCLGEDAARQDFPIFTKFCKFPGKWRRAVANYYNVPVADAKKVFLQVMFGGRCAPEGRADRLPLVEALQWEFRRAQDFLGKEHELYQKICGLEKVQKDASALSIFLAELENAALMNMKAKSEAAGCHVIALLFDGLILTSAAGLDFDRASAEIREVYGVEPAVKTARPSEGAAAPGADGEDFWGHLSRLGEDSEEMAAATNSAHQMCLPAAVLSVAPPCVARRIAAIRGPGPFSFREIEDLSDGEVQFWQTSLDSVSSAGPYILYASGHAMAVRVSEDEKMAIIYDTARARAVQAPLQQLSGLLRAEQFSVTAFALRFGESSGGDARRGGGEGFLDVRAGHRKGVKDLPRYDVKRVRKCPVSNIDHLLKAYAWFRPSNRSRQKESHACGLCGSFKHNKMTHRKIFRDILARGGKGRKGMWKTPLAVREKSKISKEAKAWKRKGAEKKAKSEWIWKSRPEDKDAYESSGGNTIANLASSNKDHRLGQSCPSSTSSAAPLWNFSGFSTWM